MKLSLLKRLTVIAVTLLTLFSLSACKVEWLGDDGEVTADSLEKKVGISMPTKVIERWERDGANIDAGLKSAGFKTKLDYANDDPALQVSQIENMITEGCSVLIVAPIDSASLSMVLEKARSKNIKIISYDRLITDTSAVDFYVTFDNYKVGTLMGQFISDKFDLPNAAGPIYMEIFSGPPSDNNAGFFYHGAVDLLQPYIDSGVINIASGQISPEQTAVEDWDLGKAQSRMENILNGYYSDKRLNVALCANDALSRGAANALLSHGYTAGASDYPVLTGQDCEVASVEYIIEGKQGMSIFKDTRELGKQAIAVTTALLNGETPESNGSYNNKVQDVPSYNCELIAVTKDNYREVLIDSGYYTAEKLGV